MSNIEDEDGEDQDEEEDEDLISGSILRNVTCYALAGHHMYYTYLTTNLS